MVYTQVDSNGVHAGGVAGNECGVVGTQRACGRLSHGGLVEVADARQRQSVDRAVHTPPCWLTQVLNTHGDC